MMNQQGRDRRDEARPDAIQWNLGFGHEQVSDTVWRCDALRAGKLYNRTLFATREEAEAFAQRLQQVEPDQIFSVEAIKANTFGTDTESVSEAAAFLQAAAFCI